MNLRKGCRASKTERACPEYNYSAGRCKLGRVKYTCHLIAQPKEGTKAHREALQARAFYR